MTQRQFLFAAFLLCAGGFLVVAFAALANGQLIRAALLALAAIGCVGAAALTEDAR